MEDSCSPMLLFSSALCLPLRVPAPQPSPFCSSSPTSYPGQLIGMAENLISVVKSYKLSTLSNLWWCTTADAGITAGECSGGQEGGRSRIAPFHLINWATTSNHTWLLLVEHIPRLSLYLWIILSLGTQALLNKRGRGYLINQVFPSAAVLFPTGSPGLYKALKEQTSKDSSIT